MAKNRLKELVQPMDCQDIPEPHPGTPDTGVLLSRQRGREAYRSGQRYEHSGELPVSDGERIEFWKGYYDEQFGRLFGREAVTHVEDC